MVAIVQVMTDEHIHLTQELFAEYFDFLRTAVDNTADDLEVVPLLAGYREELTTNHVGTRGFMKKNLMRHKLGYNRLSKRIMLISTPSGAR